MRKRWWRLRRPSIAGVRVLAFDPDGRLLLIRHSYGHDAWMLPGGGLKRGESPIAAAARELGEEAGCELVDPVEAMVQDEALWGARNRVHIVTGEARGAPRPDRREVTEAAFFAPDALPEDLANVLRLYLADWLTAATAARLRRTQ